MKLIPPFLAACLLTLAGPPVAHASEPAPTGGSPGSAEAEVARLNEQLGDLDHALRRTLRSAGLRSEEGRPPSQSLWRELERLRGAVDRLVLEGRALDGEAGRRISRKARTLRPLVTNLERALSAPPPAAGRRLPGSQAFAAPPARVPAGVGADCGAALTAAGESAFRGVLPAAAGATGTESAVWFRYTPTADGWVTASSIGSDFDSTLAVFASCPQAADQPAAAGDDEYGLQARVTFPVRAGERRWIRLQGAAGRAFVLQLGGTGVIAGTVTRGDTGAPLPDIRVEIWDGFGSYQGSDWTDVSGTYQIGGLDSGTYYATTDNYDDFLDELYDDLPCPGGPWYGCDPATGTPIPVGGGTTGGIDFALGFGGIIAGRVRDAVTGGLLAGAQIFVYDGEGDLLTSASTDAAGRYRATGLPTGTFFAVASRSGYRKELYRNLPCPGSVPWECDPATGTPIAVVRDVTTPEIDFDLEALGRITGQVTAAATGAPIAGIYVVAYSATDPYSSGAWGYTDGEGRYTLGGLDGGTYYVRTDAGYSSPWRDELYDDIPCYDGPPYYDCDPTAGTPVVVTLGATTAGIDFALDRLGGISGTVTDAVDGDPIPGIEVNIYSSSGYWLDYYYTGAAGTYGTTGLEEGSYFAIARDDYDSEYASELFDDHPCPCPATSGTPIPVAFDATTTGIDFDLDRLAAISGRVTEADGGLGVPGAEVAVFNASGNVVAGGTTAADGTYTVAGLPAGDVFVKVFHDDFLDELYDDLPCQSPPGCSATTGTPVAVAVNTTTTGIDFALDPAGRISGHLGEVGGAPLDCTLYLYDAAGSWLTYFYSNSLGDYTSPGLSPGSYFLLARCYWPHLDEIYDDVPCPESGCDPTTGTPIVVAGGVTTSAIDFVLDRLGSMTGEVTDAVSGQPLYDVLVAVIDGSGGAIALDWTDAAGNWRIDGLATGSHHVRTEFTTTHIDEQYDDVPCDPSCPPTAGAAVSVALNTTTPGIDFALRVGPGIAGTVTDASTGLPLANVAIDVWNPLGVWVAATATGVDGAYAVAVPAGTYYVSSDNGLGGLDEVYDDVPCPLGSAYEGLCDPTAGTPVVVPGGQPAVPGIDFALAGVPVFRDGFESGDLSAWSATVP